MNLSITQKATMNSLDIAELVGSRHGNVLRTIRNMMARALLQIVGGDKLIIPFC